MRLLHLNFSLQDNLGDQVEASAIREALASHFSKSGVTIEIDSIDFFEMHFENMRPAPLDERVKAWNDRYRAVIVGGGGYLDNQIARLIFSKPETWAQLKVPLFLWSVGSRMNWGQRVEKEDVHLRAMIARADLISVRDQMSFERLLNQGAKEKSILTGPLPFLALRNLTIDRSSQNEMEFDLALNLPFTHENLAQHREVLFKLAADLLERFPRTVWVAFSDVELKESSEIMKRLGKKFEVRRPTDWTSIANIYRSSRLALSTKLHATLFPSGLDVPVVSLSYDEKCDAWMQMIAGSYARELTVQLRDAQSEKIFAALQLAEKERETLKQSYAKAYSQFSAEHARYLEKLTSMIGL